MSVDLFGRASTIHMIGESHAIQFGDLLFRPEWSPRLYLCKSRFFQHLPASHYRINGVMNPLLSSALIAEGIIDDKSQACFLIRDWAPDFIANRAVLSPPMVFFAGDVDMQTVTYQTGNRYDFELPGDPGYGVDFDKEPMAYQAVRQRIEEFFAPFITVVGEVGALFPRTMIHALPPRIRDSERASRWTGKLVVDAPLRAKLIVVANEVLAAGCAAAAIPFINTWPEIAVDGYLHPDFDLDGLHLNQRAAAFSLDAITAVLHDHTGPTAHPTRYQHLYEFGPDYQGPGDGGIASWIESGWTAGDLGDRSVAGFCNDLVFVDDPANPDASPEWIGYPRAGRPGIAVAEPSERLLEAAARLFSVGAARARLQVGQPKELTVCSFRPVQLAPGRDTGTALPTPWTCRRAILCLDGAGSVVCETLASEVVGEQTARPGMLVVYDPGRVRCRAVAGDEPARFAELALMPRFGGHPFRVTYAGLRDWPADPFNYPLNGVKAFPPFAERNVNAWCYPEP